MANINITADNLPKDSGNRYSWAPYDPSASAYMLPLAYPVSGSFGGQAIGHMVNVVTDTIPSGGSTGAGVDMGGYLYGGMLVPQMTPCQFEIQVASANTGGVGVWFNERSNDGATTGRIYSGLSGTAYAANFVTDWNAYRHLRVSANSAQTAARLFTFLFRS